MESISVVSAASSDAATAGSASADIVTSANSSAEIDGVPVPVSVVHVTIPNQSVSVQSMLQGGVIQTAGGQTIQAIQVQVGEGDAALASLAGAEDEESKKRRELLARRPSYRKILNELSGEPGSITVTKVEEESNSSQTSQDSASEAQPEFVPIQIATGEGAGALQTLTMTNVATSTASSAAPTVLQYAQGADGQIFIPGNLNAGNIQYQITPATSLGQSVVMATTGATVATSAAAPGEEAARKRELRLLKNREAARECRRKKKDYIKCLENRVALLENQNKTLIEELKSLKELYCQKEVQ